MVRLFCNLMGNQRGATAVEYGFIISLVVIACVGAISQVAVGVNGMWNNVATAVIQN